MILLEIMDSILYLSIAMLISMGIITTIFAQLTSLDLTILLLLNCMVETKKET